MDTKSLEMLEFHRVREIIAGYTSFPASQALALNLLPISDYDKIHLLFKQSYEARQILAWNMISTSMLSKISGNRSAWRRAAK